MKKSILFGLILSSLSIPSFAENIGFAGTIATSCAFSNYVTGTLDVHVLSNTYYLDGGMDGLGAPGRVTIDYTGSPTFSITGVGNLDSSPNGTPSINQYSTGVYFGDAANTANAITAGADGFNGQVTKYFLLDPTNVTQDVAYVKMSARATSPFPVGNYTAHAVVTCQ